MFSCVCVSLFVCASVCGLRPGLCVCVCVCDSKRETAKDVEGDGVCACDFACVCV